MSRDGMICPGTERGMGRYARGRNEGRNGTKRNEGRNGTIISKNVKIPMRLNCGLSRGLKVSLKPGITC